MTDSDPPAPIRTPSTTLAHYDDILIEPYTYITKIPGKGVRSKLMAAFNVWLQVDPAILEKVGDIVEQLHNASLLIDDIEDNSTLRRGIPVAHAVFGIPATINCANYVYFRAQKMCNDLNNPTATKIFLDCMLRLHRGQGLDIHWRDHQTCPSEEEYRAMVLDKTGGLFRLAVLLMQAFSHNDTDLIPIVQDLGLFYQVADDYLNLQSTKYHQNKSFCEDLTEGKYSFPIIHSLRKAPSSDTRLASILKQRTTDVTLKEYALEIMRETGTFEYTKDYVLTLKRCLMAHIEELGGNPALAAIIEAIARPIEDGTDQV